MDFRQIKKIAVYVGAEQCEVEIIQYENDYYDITKVRSHFGKMKRWVNFTDLDETETIANNIKKNHNVEAYMVLGKARGQKIYVHKTFLKYFLESYDVHMDNDDMPNFIKKQVDEDIENILQLKEFGMAVSENNKQTKKERGYVYCLSHPLFDGVYKIGCTQITPDERAKQLSGTGHYIDFKVELAKYVDDYVGIERLLHTLFNKYRVNNNREFFKLSLKKINDIFEMLEGDEYVYICDSEEEEPPSY